MGFVCAVDRPHVKAYDVRAAVVVDQVVEDPVFADYRVGTIDCL